VHRGAEWGWYMEVLHGMVRGRFVWGWCMEVVHAVMHDGAWSCGWRGCMACCVEVVRRAGAWWWCIVDGAWCMGMVYNVFRKRVE
jgi:hypothetical protein